MFKERSLSAYKIMWIMVMFDLPVTTFKERKAATKFRNTLLDYGFEMSQYSIYVRRHPSASQVESTVKKIQNEVPKEGRVSLLEFTDKQFERIKILRGSKTLAQKYMHDQFILF